MSLHFYVQSVPSRASWDITKKNLDGSDAAGRYTRIVQQENETARENFRRTFTEMANADCEWVVRLEDDLAGINKHIVSNILSWNAKEDPKFGAGWLFAPGGGKLHRLHHPKGSQRWTQDLIHGALGVLMKRTLVMSVLEGAEEWFHQNPGFGGDDIAICYGVVRMHKHIAIHSPSLLEHWDGPSASGHVFLRNAHTSRGTFDQEWQRKK